MRTPWGASPHRRLLACTGLSLWLMDAWQEMGQPQALAKFPVPDVPMVNMGNYEAEEEPLEARQMQAQDGATNVENAAAIALADTEQDQHHENSLAAWDASRVESGAYLTASPSDIQESSILTTEIDAHVFVWNYGHPGDLTLPAEGLPGHNETMQPDMRDVNIGLTGANACKATATNGLNKETAYGSQNVHATDSEWPLSSAALLLQPDLLPFGAGGGWGTNPALPNLTDFTNPEGLLLPMEGDDQLESENGEGRVPSATNSYALLQRSTLAGERNIVSELMTYGSASAERQQAHWETTTGRGGHELAREQIREVVEQVLLDIYASMEPL